MTSVLRMRITGSAAARPALVTALRVQFGPCRRGLSVAVTVHQACDARRPTPVSVVLVPMQTRFKSTAPKDGHGPEPENASEERPEKQPEERTESGLPTRSQMRRGPAEAAAAKQKERVRLLPLLLRIARGSVRGLARPFRVKTLRELYRSNPEELVLGLIVLAMAVGVVAYVVQIYFSYFYARQFTRYPASVAKYLRRALYFGSYNPDAKRALKNYKLALEECDRLQLDPFSDDVLGIRIQLASWLESIENYEAALTILELVLADCRRWTDLMDEAMAADTKLSDAATLVARLPPPLTRGWKTTDKTDTTENTDDGRETIWGRRSRILQKAIGVSVKLGALYADEHVLQPERSHTHLQWAVDAALGEARRRQADGPRVGEGPWMSPAEMGGALESLGTSYMRKSQFQLALPLLFQALRLCDDACHTATIMANLATAFAEHPVVPPYTTLVGSVVDTKPDGPAPTAAEARAAFLATAERWATNAEAHARATTGKARTQECDEACAAALCGLADIALLQGRVAEAKQRFQQALLFSQELAYEPGISQAEAGLQRSSHQLVTDAS